MTRRLSRRGRTMIRCAAATGALALAGPIASAASATPDALALAPVSTNVPVSTNALVSTLAPTSTLAAASTAAPTLTTARDATSEQVSTGDGSALDTILHHLARPAPSTTPFIEARFSPMLSRPLVVSGELEYLGPGSLARIVRKPYHERAEIRGDEVTVQRGDQPPQHFALDRAPEMRSLVASFSALLSGNVAALRSEFTLDLHGDERRWTIGLTPLDPRVHQRIRSILVSGAGSEPRCLTTFQANDDTDVMLLAEAAHGSAPAMPDRAWFDAQCRGASAPHGRSNPSPQR